MIGVLRKRLFGVMVFLALVLGLSTLVYRIGFVQALDQLSARGTADMAVASDRLVGQLQRYRDLAVFLADHPRVAAVLAGEDADATAMLQGVVDRATALDVMILRRSGHVAAAVRADRGVNMGGLPFVKRALNGALGWGDGASLPLTQRAFFHVSPVLDGNARVLGAVLVSTDLNGIDYSWRGANPAVLFTNASGRVVVSNRSELVFWQRPEGQAGLVPPAGETPSFSRTYWQAHEIWKLGWGRYLPQEALHLSRPLPVIGMTAEVLLDIAPVRRLALAQAAAVAALCLAFGAFLFLATERRRTLAAANAGLEVRVLARTAALREINYDLRREAAEREEAQAALRRAQADLVQAGKLGALGQMSAGISHELNQPLMAIRSFAENAVQFMEKGKPERARENLKRISDMARRMGRIIQSLRAFSRQETQPDQAVDLCETLQSALDLTRGYMRDAGVALHYTAPIHSIPVRGGEVRLAQVFVNLITNAVDAMAQSAQKALQITITQADDITVSLRDTGPGIEMPDKAFDPFYTTKHGGETAGMGLGLSISYGIVQSFGGQIKGRNCKDGGAEFSVTLERSKARARVA